MNEWKDCKNILCVRADNMGDVLMSVPAFRALKTSFNCRLTLLTSGAGACITPHLEDVDDVIISDLPWSANRHPATETQLAALIKLLRSRHFDGAVIFTVYSQNPLPSATLVYMAGIPLRAAYCRENPYRLLTNWLPDEEPFSPIQHQVKRDMNLTRFIGAHCGDDLIKIHFQKTGVLPFPQGQKYVLFHPGVSETKRQFPVQLWIAAGKLLQQKTGLPIVVTGIESERLLADKICGGIVENAFSMAGKLNINEWINVIHHASVVVSVNTSTAHIAAATQTPVVVLYAATNPQHTPWKVASKVLYFPVALPARSKNTMVKYGADKMDQNLSFPTAEDIFAAIKYLRLHPQYEPDENVGMNFF